MATPEALLFLRDRRDRLLICPGCEMWTGCPVCEHLTVSEPGRPEEKEKVKDYRVQRLLTFLSQPRSQVTALPQEKGLQAFPYI